MDRKRLLSLYRNMLIARGVDRIEQELTSRGEAFFHLSGAGHEGTAVLANHLTEADWLHCHYRDRALLVARGLSPEPFRYTALQRILAWQRSTDECILQRPRASYPEYGDSDW